MLSALRIFTLALALNAAESFLAIPGRTDPARSGVAMMGARKATPLGRTSTAEGKAVKLAAVTEKLETASLIFAVPQKGMTVKQLSQLRSKLPPGTSAMVVKNKLMGRAIEGGSWSAAADALSQENMWFFVPEEEFRPTLETYAAWVKEFKLEESPIKGGVLDGGFLDAAGVKKLEKLPTKLELYAKIAGALQKAGAQGIAVRLKKAAGGQLVKAVKLAYTDAEKRPDAPTE
mmetsp:Transcript_32659/g.59636  ORF Transcript_32659/g.59636 Transcript_32659/m.59636 type:complete len:232 (+) Transcript_32659:58-753(+)